MPARPGGRVLFLFLGVAGGGLSPQPMRASSGPRIAVLPITESATPSLKAACVAASRVEGLLNRQGELDVVDSGTTVAGAAAVGNAVVAGK